MNKPTKHQIPCGSQLDDDADILRMKMADASEKVLDSMVAVSDVKYKPTGPVAVTDWTKDDQQQVIDMVAEQVLDEVSGIMCRLDDGVIQFIPEAFESQDQLDDFKLNREPLPKWLTDIKDLDCFMSAAFYMNEVVDYFYRRGQYKKMIDKYLKLRKMKETKRKAL